MDGIFGADELCQNSADAAELGGTWRTYLATSGSEPWEGIYGEGPWVDLAGTVLFNNEAGLTLDPIAPLAIDQFGDGVSGFVWIGSEQDNCQNWTALQEGVELYYGALGCAWGQSVDGWNQSGTTFCGDSARLYCFELGE